MSPYGLGRCLYCGAALDTSTNQEHIIPKGLGGSLATTKTVCSGCNEGLGKDVDELFVKRYHLLLNCLQPALWGSIKAPEVTGEILGERRTFEAGFRPRERIKVTINSNGKPVRFSAPDEKTARKLKKHLRSEPVTEEECIYYIREKGEVEHVMYSASFVRACAKMCLEFGDYFSQLAETDLNQARFRARAFHEITTFVNQNLQPSFLSGHKLYCFPELKSKSDAVFAELGCPDSPSRHRILLSASNRLHQVLGLLDLFQGDIWACPLSTSYTGMDFTYLYQRSLIRGTQTDWSCRTNDSLVHCEELEAVSCDTNITPDHPIHVRYKEILNNTVYHIELNYSKEFERDLRFLVERGEGEAAHKEVANMMEARLRKLFGDNQGWDREWQRIRLERLVPFETATQLSKSNKIVHLALLTYRELLENCRDDIGPVTLWDVLSCSKLED